MTSRTTEKCQRCRASLAAWERGTCSCTGARSSTNRDVLYAVACSASGPLYARDFVRIAETDFGARLDVTTALATLAPDWRFCWAGQGLYGLYRHGLLPGPRKLEEAARVLLVAAGRSMDSTTADYCLKRFGYRYNVASLRNAVSRSQRISRDWYGHWDHPRGEVAERALRTEIQVVPPRHRADWIQLRDATTRRIKHAMAERAARLKALAAPSVFGMNWED